MSYTSNILRLFEGVHAEVKPLFDPKTQKRKFPKRALANFLKKKDVTAVLNKACPYEITKLVGSIEKLDLVPSEILRQYLAEMWDLVPMNIQSAIDGAQDPRAPTQGSSDFVINRELGDWAESVVKDAVNKADADVCAFHYGRRDRLIAGEAGFEELFLEHQNELKEVGKRPDLLLYDKNELPSNPFDGKSAKELVETAKRAVVAFEVRSSQQTLDDFRDPAKLSFTPKVEDIRNVVKWIETHGVPHFYVQVLFGRVYTISFERILKLLATPPASKEFRIARVPRNQFKSTIFIPLTSGICLSTAFEQPQSLKASIKKLSNGRIIVLIEFSGGAVTFDQTELRALATTARTSKAQ